MSFTWSRKNSGSRKWSTNRQARPAATSIKTKQGFWRPRRDLNPCCRRERPMSWARLDDGDANGEPCWIRTSDPLLKSAESRQTEYHTLLNLLGFSSHFLPQSNHRQIPFGGSSRTKHGQSARKKGAFSSLHQLRTVERELLIFCIKRMRLLRVSLVRL